MKVTDNCLSDVDTTYTLFLNGANVGSGTGDASGTVFDLGTTTVTYTVTDDNGNSETCESTVNITETSQDAVLTGIGDLNSDCGQDTMVVPIIILQDFTASFIQFALEWDPALTYVSFEDFLGPSAHGNYSNNLAPNILTASTFILPPVAFEEGDTLFLLTLVIPPDGMPGAVYSIDLRPDLIVPIVGDNAIPLPNNFELQILAGSITIDADDPPTITCPADTVIDCTVSSVNIDTSITGSPVISGNCSDELQLLFMDIEVPLNGNSLEITRKFIVEDVWKQSSECTQKIIVIDTSPPEAICSSTSICLNASGSVTIAPALLDGGSTDNCINPISLAASKEIFSCANLGPNNVQLIVTDPTGNTDSCTATLTIKDCTSPLAACRDITVTLNEEGVVILNPASIYAGIPNDCDEPMNLNLIPSSLSCEQIGEVEVTLQLNDPAGNSASCKSVVTLMDSMEHCQNSCPDILSLGPSAIVHGFYQASNYLTANGPLVQGSATVFQAGTSVILQPGFNVSNGTSFLAVIGPCEQQNQPSVQDDPLPLPVNEVSGSRNEEVREVEPENKSLLVAVYPNPFTGQFTIDLTLTEPSPIDVYMRPIHGGSLVQVARSEVLPPGRHALRIDGQQQPSGVYLLLIRTGSHTIPGKIVKVR